MTVTSRLHRQKGKERQRKTGEKVDRRPVVAPRYESGGEAQALVRPARDRGLPLQMMIISFPVFFREDKKKKKNWIVSRTGGSSVTSERAQEVLAAHDGRA